MNKPKQHIKSMLQKSELFSHLDIHFADFIQRLDGRDSPEIYLAAALVSNYNRHGNICLDLTKLEGKILFADENQNAIVGPPLKKWVAELNSSPTVGKPGEFKPLILDEHNRFYLYRYWEYQHVLAKLIESRLHASEVDFDPEQVRNILNQLFDKTSNREIDWQRVAGFTAMVKKFCVISGGPGTGKTTTLAKIMALLVEQNDHHPLRVSLAAPTGKAAARLQEGIKITKKNLNCPESVKKLIPEEASTIHRLLGTISNSPYFRYNADNPLPVDVMIIDEASMVDMALMSKLVQALPVDAKLILVGDKDQLASVEAGAVLGDICDTGNYHGYSEQFCQNLYNVFGIEQSDRQTEQTPKGIQDCIIHLKKSFRFSEESGIGAVSQSVNNGDGHTAVQILKDVKYPDAKWQPLPVANILPRMLKVRVIQEFKNYLTETDPLKIFQLFDQFRILCAVRGGPYGASQVNDMVENILAGEKLIHKDKSWYHGRPILITVNDYNLDLFNGDVGIALRDSESNHEIRVFFIDADYAIRKFHPLRLPQHETVFALTVHKSQGSEFERVLLLLPGVDSPVLSRELIYTGITRARKNVEVWGIEQIFNSAVVRRIERTSGLRDALWD